MKQSETNQLGATGQSLTQYKFERLGWGPVPVAQHDVGTDFFVQVRDPDRNETGALLGVQTKTGPHAFKRRAILEGQQGWYYSIDATHRDYWVEHDCPHILLLIDHEKEEGYWQSISPETTISAGKNWRIFVPEENLLGEESRDRLFKYALSENRKGSWEGTVWGGRERLSSENQLRAAFLTPRLIAPHPNEGRGPKDFLEAIACVLSGRTSLIARYGHKGQAWLFPDKREPDSALSEIYALLSRWFSGGNFDSKRAQRGFLYSNHEYVAWVVCNASYYLELGKAEDARKVLSNAIHSPRKFSDGDFAWLSVCLSWALRDVGKVEEAEKTLEHALSLSALLRNDPTGGSLRSSTISSLLAIRFARQTGDSLQASLNGLDNQSNLWMDQLENKGLSASLTNSARELLQDRSIRLGTNDAGYVSLRAASLVSALSGNASRWRHNTQMLTFHLLCSYQDGILDPSTTSRALQCIPSQELKLFVKHSIRKGAIDPVLDYVKQIGPDAATFSNIRTDLEVVKLIADYLCTEEASRLASWLLQEIREEYPTVRRLHTYAGSHLPFIDTLAGLYPVADREVQSAIREHLIKVLPLGDESLSSHYSSWFLMINPSHWETGQIEQIVDSRKNCGDTLRSVIDQVFPRHNTELFAELTGQIEAGSISAYLNFGLDRALPRTHFASVIEELRKVVEDDIKSSERGASFGRSYSPIVELARLSLIFPEASCWNEIISFLRPHIVRAEETGRALRFLAQHAGEIPRNLIDPLSAVALSWSNKTLDFFFVQGQIQEEIRANALELFFKLNADKFSSLEQLKLLTGNRFEIVAGLRVADFHQTIDNWSLALFTEHEISEISALALSLVAQRWIGSSTGEADDLWEIINESLDSHSVDRQVVLLNTALASPSEGPRRTALLKRLAESRFIRIAEHAHSGLQ